MHPVSTEHNMSPEQLYISGTLDLGRTNLIEIEGILSHEELQYFGTGVSDDEDYLLPDSDDYDVNVPEISCGISDALLNEIYRQIDPLSDDGCCGVNHYINCLELVQQELNTFQPIVTFKTLNKRNTIT